MGCIGVGTAGATSSMLSAHAPNVKVTAISDVYGPHRQKGLERCLNPQAKAYVDYRELLADKNVDAVVIATPDHRHCQMVLDAVKAGKDIYCEKGFSRTLTEAKLMRDALKRSKVVFQLGTRRAKPPARCKRGRFIAAGASVQSRSCAPAASSPPSRTIPTGAGTAITISGTAPIRRRFLRT